MLQNHIIIMSYILKSPLKLKVAEDLLAGVWKLDQENGQASEP